MSSATYKVECEHNILQIIGILLQANVLYGIIYISYLFSVTEDDVEPIQIGSKKKSNDTCLQALTKHTKRKLFILQWISKYSGQDFVGDLLAGITIGLTVIPQSMALANVAGLPPQVINNTILLYL